MHAIGLGLGIGYAATEAVALNALDDRIVFDGDSIVAHGHATVDAYAGNGSWGFSTWALALSEGRLFQPIGGNLGVSGDTVADMYARRAATVARLPKVVCGMCGTNDVGAGTAAATITAGLRAYWNYMLASGARYVVWCTILPRFAPNSLSGGSETIRQAVNAWMLAQASRRIKIVDCEALDLSSDDFGDGLHPNTGGAFKIGQAVAAVLDAITTAADVIAGWTNAYSVNPTMTGTGGSLNGGATGVVADGFGLDATQAGGANVVGSKGVLADGSPAQIITISGSYSGSGRYINFASFSASTLEAGDELEYVAEIEVEGLSAEIVRVTPIAAVYDGSFATLFQSEGVYAGDSAGHPDAVERQVIRTPPWTIQAGAPAWELFGLAIGFKDAAGPTAVAGTIRIGENKARKVPPGG
ncbi:MAG TPA: SGNH/GDSL hydrolase family protein [Devosia sp.]|nr:SGNH/GDSL hydrolase family protein [Devosia sp.]